MTAPIDISFATLRRQLDTHLRVGLPESRKRVAPMKLKKVRVREFQSIQDSGEFEVSEITCLVGKNEAGKTALLRALYKLNPLVGKKKKGHIKVLLGGQSVAAP